MLGSINEIKKSPKYRDTVSLIKYSERDFLLQKQFLADDADRNYKKRENSKW